MVRPQRHVDRAGSRERSSQAWIQTLRADIKHIHELRWELSGLVETQSPAQPLPSAERNHEIAQIRIDAQRQLDKFEQDVHDDLDPYLKTLEQDLIERGLLEDGKTTHSDRPPGAVLVAEWNDLQRLRAAKLRAIDLARQVLRQEHEGERTRRGKSARVKEAVLRGAFFVGFCVFFAASWLWAHLFRRDKYRH